MKVGRNQLCPCGSGKKYKRCHGALAAFSAPLPPHVAAAIDSRVRAQHAQEHLRQIAEGHGRPIITAEMDGARFVAVKNRIHWSKNWRFFTDFLRDFVWIALSKEWAQRVRAAGSKHPLFTWWDAMNEGAVPVPDGDGAVEISLQGPALAFYRFAYALYLIAHHDTLPKPLVERLRDSERFRPAVAEVVAVAAFALAGHEVKMGETGPPRAPEGEFLATAPASKNTYAVEVKRKSGWKAPPQIGNPEFDDELKRWLRGKIYDASRKRLQNPIYWFELSLPRIADQAGAEHIQSLVALAVREAEANLLVDGQRPGSAYVIVTNHSHFADNFVSHNFLAILEGFHKVMPRLGEALELEMALEIYDRDRDITCVLKCLEGVQQIPQGFDGVPQELLGPNGQTTERLSVGQPINIVMPDKTEISGLVTHVLGVNDHAFITVLDEFEGTQRIIEIPLTEDERRLHKRFGDAVFGGDARLRSNDEDPVRLYDFFLKTYASYDCAALHRQLPNHPNMPDWEQLPIDQLRRRVSREMVKVLMADAANRQAG